MKEIKMIKALNALQVSVVSGTYHVFGSGGASASLVIDGVKLNDCVDLGHNGFIGWYGTNVPISQLLAAKTVVWSQDSDTYSGTGRGFIRRYCASHGKGDSLAILLRHRDYAMALTRKRYTAQWLLDQADKKKSGYQFRRLHGQTQQRNRQHFTLPDGSKGGKWSSWAKVYFRYTFAPQVA